MFASVRITAAAVALSLFAAPFPGHAAVVLVHEDSASLILRFSADPAVCGGFGFGAGGPTVTGSPFFAGPLQHSASFCGATVSAAVTFAPTGPGLVTAASGAPGVNGLGATAVYRLDFQVTEPGTELVISGWAPAFTDATTSTSVPWTPGQPILLQPHRYSLSLVALTDIPPSSPPLPPAPGAAARFTNATFRVPAPPSAWLLAVALAGLASSIRPRKAA